MGKKFAGPGGFVHDVTPEQKQALEQFKEMVQSTVAYNCKPGSWFQLSDDRVLLKFLRARNFGLDEALAMVKHHVEMRQTWKVDDMSLEDPDLQEAFKSGIWRMAGESRQHHPIQHIQVGDFIPGDVKSMESFTKSTIFQREWAAARMVEQGWKAETTMVLFDMDRWSLFVQGAPSGMKFTRVLIDISQSAYPEFLEKAIIFNAPWVFRTAWAIIKPWLDEATANRVIFVSDPAALHELIDPSQLEVRYGGEREPWPITS